MTSTIDTTVPATDSALTSAPIRNNFVAAANDINGIETILSGLGNMSTQSQNNVTITGGAIAGTALNAGTVPFSALASIANNTVLGNLSGGSAAPSALTKTQLTTLINPFTAGQSGAVPASGGGTTNFLRADGTFASPGSGSVTSVGLAADGFFLTETGSPITSSGTITLAKATHPALTLIGNPSGAPAVPTDIEVGPTLVFSGANLRTSAITGDVTAPANSFATTLANVNSNVGTYTNATVTVNAKGLVTAASGGTVVVTSVSNSDGTLTISPTGGNVIASRAALTGDVTASAGSNATTLATVNSNVGSFGSSTLIPSVTVNGKGLVTAVSTNAVTPAATSITGSTAYSLLGNNTNATANAANIQYPVLGAPGYTVVSASTFGRITGSNAGFYEFNIQNTSANVSASTDFVATADNGSGSTHYVDFGINSSLGGVAPFATANAAYLYTTDNELDLAAIGAAGIVNIYAGATPTLIASFNNNGVVTMPGLVSGIVVADSSGVLSTRATSMVWNDTTGTTQALAVNNGYVADNASLVTFTLPVTAAFGSIISIVGKGAGGWTLAQNSGQTVHYGGKDTTTGVGGSIASTQQRDCLDLICTTANTDWTVRSSIGSPNAT